MSMISWRDLFLAIALGLLLLPGCILNSSSSGCVDDTGCKERETCVAKVCVARCPKAPCADGQLCVRGACVTMPETAGRTLSAGGGISSSAGHIHVNLTGQGRATGTSGGVGHTVQAGATSVLQR